MRRCEECGGSQTPLSYVVEACAERANTALGLRSAALGDGDWPDFSLH